MQTLVIGLVFVAAILIEVWCIEQRAKERRRYDGDDTQ
jgi:hypothetical protein